MSETPRRYSAEEIYYAAEHARPLKWSDSAGEHEIDLEALLYSAAEDASRLEQIEKWAKSETLHLSVLDVRADALHDAKAEALRLLRDASAGRRKEGQS